MNILKLFTKTYGLLHNYNGVPFWVLTPLRKFVRWLANTLLPSYLSKRYTESSNRLEDVVISFTSFPARIKEVWMVVESLKHQSVLPEKIILWLSKEQFPNEEDVSQTLRDCEDDLFEIRMVDEDIRSHKKFYYVMQEFPDKTFVTCDDDIFYDCNMLKRLVETSKRFPGCIVANHTKSLTYSHTGELNPYKLWDHRFKPYSSLNNVQIGVGGVLYPPGCLHDLVLRKDLFWKLTPMADDIWLNAMSRLKGTPVVQTGREIMPLPIKSDAPKLSSVNAGKQNMNDKQIQQLREWLQSEQMPDIYAIGYDVNNNNATI